MAGLLVAANAAAALATPLGLWAVALAAMLLVRGRFRVERASSTTLRADIAEGAGVFNFATSGTFAIFVLSATGAGSVMHLSKPSYGLLLATAAAGSVIGSFLAERIVQVLGRARSLMLTIPGGALLVGIPAITTRPLLVGAGFFAGGAAIIVWNVVVLSLRQRITPGRLLGRVNSAYRLVAWGVMPLGAAAGGVLAQLAGLRTVFVIMAALMLTLLAGLRVVTDDRMAAAERHADYPNSDREPAR